MTHNESSKPNYTGDQACNPSPNRALSKDQGPGLCLLDDPGCRGEAIGMTICVSVRVAEGLVLAADSAVMLHGVVNTPKGPRPGLLQTFAYGNKVSQIKDYPIGVMTWGAGSLKARSIQSLIMEFELEYPEFAVGKSYTVRQVADDLLAFIKPRYDEVYAQSKSQGQLGLLVGGYSASEFFADEFVYEFPASKDWSPVRPDDKPGNPSFGANWFGATDALIRLVLGFDPQALTELVKRGADQKIVQKWVDDQVAALPLVFDGMPLQDAIDFAGYAANVVIGRYRFGLGPALCGGDIDIAVITPTAFRWAQRKAWAIRE